MKSLRFSLVIVDDESTMRIMLTDFLTSQGYEVRSFLSASEALRYLRSSEGHLPFVVVSDIRMHPMNGLDFLKVLKRDFPSIPVILFTGAGNPEEKKYALKLGAVQYLTKPFSLTGLKGCIDGLALASPPKSSQSPPAS